MKLFTLADAFEPLFYTKQQARIKIGAITEKLKAPYLQLFNHFGRIRPNKLNSFTKKLAHALETGAVLPLYLKF